MPCTCLVRKKQVSATPEEKVRQACLKWMVHSLGYPLEAIVVEKGVKEFLPLLDLPFTERRIDILATSLGKPLLVIECKAHKTGSQEKLLSQLLGYHHWLKTPFAALADPSGIRTLTVKDGEPFLINGLPRYETILGFSHSLE